MNGPRHSTVLYAELHSLLKAVRMDLATVLSNDQVAILGCFGALAACGLVATLTYHFGPAGKKSAKAAAPRISLSERKNAATGGNTRKAA